MKNWENVERLQEELRDAIQQATIDDLKPASPYVAWSNEHMNFYVSTTSDDDLDGYISMQWIVTDFIKNYKLPADGMIDESDAVPFITELELAAERIKCAIRK
tara:strand:- start:25327 stop:25635 length:309 start_codon:yes stop_codon:yes gene_type:complete